MKTTEQERMETWYQPIMAAHFAHQIAIEAEANRTTPEAVIIEDLGSMATDREIADALGRLHHGQDVLREFSLAYSWRFTAEGSGQAALDDMVNSHKLATGSTAFRVPAGHIATNSAWRWAALARRS